MNLDQLFKKDVIFPQRVIRIDQERVRRISKFYNRTSDALRWPAASFSSTLRAVFAARQNVSGKFETPGSTLALRLAQFCAQNHVAQFDRVRQQRVFLQFFNANLAS